MMQQYANCKAIWLQQSPVWQDREQGSSLAYQQLKPLFLLVCHDQGATATTTLEQ
jgi:hypothetical protein